MKNGLMNTYFKCMRLCYTGIAPGGAPPRDFCDTHVGLVPFVAAMPGIVFGVPLLRDVGAV